MRFEQPKRSVFSGPDLEAYDKIIERRKSQVWEQERADDLPPLAREPVQPLSGGSGEPDAGPYAGALLNAPIMGGKWFELGALVRTRADHEGSFSNADREFSFFVLAGMFGTNMGQVRHIPDALVVGVRREALEVLRRSSHLRPAERDRLEASVLTEDERLLAAYTRELIGGDVKDATFDQMVERMGKQALLEFSIHLVYWFGCNRLHLLFEENIPSDDECLDMLTRFRDGVWRLPSREYFDALNR